MGHAITTGIRLPLLAAALGLAAYAAFSGSPYTLRVLTVAGVYALLVVGYQFVFGYAGALSLAQGTFFGLGAYATGILGSQLGWTFLATFPLSVLLPLALAAATLMCDSNTSASAASTVPGSAPSSTGTATLRAQSTPF